MTTQIEQEATTTSVIGARIKRVEDPQLITGAAKYLDDMKLLGMAHAAIVRSPYAHARIKSIDTSRAAAHPGVVAVYTGKDFGHLNPLPCAWQAGGARNLPAPPPPRGSERRTLSR